MYAKACKPMLTALLDLQKHFIYLTLCPTTYPVLVGVVRVQTRFGHVMVWTILVPIRVVSYVHNINKRLANRVSWMGTFKFEIDSLKALCRVRRQCTGIIVELICCIGLIAFGWCILLPAPFGHWSP